MAGLRSGRTCGTCRQRKIKCDGRRPACRQCTRGARLCAGFEIIFVNHNDRIGAIAPGKMRSNVSCGPIYDLMETGLHEQRMFARLLQENLPAPYKSTGHIPLNWMRSIISVDCTSLLKLTLVALTSGWYGHIDRRQDLSIRGRHAYSTALKYLRVGLGYIGQDSSRDLQFLASIELLALYELFEFGAAKAQGWTTHLSGAETILQIRSREVENAPLYCQIFHWHRIIAVSLLTDSNGKFYFFTGAKSYGVLQLVNGISTRKKTFLSNPIWSQDPWWRTGNAGFDELVDIGVDITAFLETADFLTSQPPTGPVSAQYTGLLTWYLTLFDAMRALRKRWKFTVYAGPQKMDPGMSIKYSEGEHQTHYPCKSPEPIWVPFDDLQTARLLQLYNSLFLTMHLTMLRVAKHQQSPTQSADLMAFVKEISSRKSLIIEESRTLADGIVMQAGFCTQSAWLSFGIVVAIFNLRTALDWYNFDAEQDSAKLDQSLSSGPSKLSRDRCVQLLETIQIKERPT